MHGQGQQELRADDAVAEAQLARALAEYIDKIVEATGEKSLLLLKTHIKTETHPFVLDSKLGLHVTNDHKLANPTRYEATSHSEAEGLLY